MAEINNRLIIVDDEPGILQAYLDILAPSGGGAKRSSRFASQGGGSAASPAANDIGSSYEILKANNGVEAIKIVQTELEAGRRIAGGFFDVKMEGGIDGIETVREVWKLDPEIRCTVVTAYQDRSINDIDTIFGNKHKDQWDYLNKPFTQAEIIQKARQMVAAWNRKRELEEAMIQLEATQAQLISSERMAAIGQVARAIGHEFGNILQTMIGKADVALQLKELPKVHEKVKVVLQAGERASLIVRNLQSFSKEKPVQGPVDPAKVIRDTLTLVNHELKKNSVEVVDQIGACASITGNSVELEQVFLNLIINAIHAMPSGGKIELGCKDDGSHVEMWVQDTGTGIPPEVLPRIFDYAFTTKGEKGSGLGLSISKKIVEGHGGTIEAKSEAGKGARFVIRIPRGAGEAK